MAATIDPASQQMIQRAQDLGIQTAFDRAATIDPLHEICRLNKGIILLHDLNDPEAAAQAWEELLEVNPLATAPGGQPVAELVKSLKSVESNK